MATSQSHSNPVINVGIIGAGYGLTGLLPVLASIPEFKVIFISKKNQRIDDTKMESLTLKNSIFVTPDEIISNKNINLVVIASPPITQEEYALAALESNKNIYCEKPVGLNSKSSMRIMEVANKTNLISSVGYQFRYDPMIKWLKHQLTNGELGEIYRVEIRWETSGGITTPALSWRNQLKQGGGVLRDFGSHVFDYLSFIDQMNFPQSLSNLNDDHRFKNNMHCMDIQNINFSGRFGSVDLHCVISRTCVSPIGHEIRLIGSKAQARVIHSPPFRGVDLKLEIIMKSGLHKDTTQYAYFDSFLPKPILQKLDSRQLSSRRLFLDLAQSINGNVSEKLPTLLQAVLNQNVVDEAESVLFSV